MCEIAPLHPAEEGQDQGRVVSGDTGPSVPHTSHIIDAWVDKETLRRFGCISGFLGALMGSPWVVGV